MPWHSVHDQDLSYFQVADEVLTFPVPAFPEIPELCLLTSILKVEEQATSDYLSGVPGGGMFAYQSFSDKLKETLRLAGIDPTGYNTHSFRRGGATWAFLAGVPAHVIKIMGNWKSDAYLRYLDFPAEYRFAAGELMKLHMKRLLL